MAALANARPMLHWRSWVVAFGRPAAAAGAVCDSGAAAARPPAHADGVARAPAGCPQRAPDVVAGDGDGVHGCCGAAAGDAVAPGPAAAAGCGVEATGGGTHGARGARGFP